MYLERFRLDGRVAFVTGGAQGIGLCIAEALAEAGAKVVIADLVPKALDDAVRLLSGKGYDVEPELLDVTRSADVDRVADDVVRRLGKVDILVNNAGIARSETPAEEVQDEHWLNVLDVNLNGSFWCARAFGKHMQIRAVNRWSKLDLPELTTLFFEFHGSERYVAEQVETVKELTSANGGGEFRWANHTEERSALWKARHEAYYAAVNLRPGAIGWATDVCVPISRLAECISETKAELDASSVPATILGHAECRGKTVRAQSVNAPQRDRRFP